MTQLSTDTLAYSQVISKVQDFLLRYAKNENNSPKDFDKAYKDLLSQIQTSIGSPLSELKFFNKGEIPSSDKFNNFSSNISKDVNMILNQFDSLVANYVNTFNHISNQIELEKNLISRIRSKINVLDLYSSSSATNITYFGDLFNNLDFIDVNKIKQNRMPEVSNGFACLPTNRMKKMSGSIKIVNQNYNDQITRNIQTVDISNGLAGSYHLFHIDETKGNPFLYEKDSALLRSNELAMLDESPATYFEYEAINVKELDDTGIGTVSRMDYEFLYSDNTTSVNRSFINWSSFDRTKPLKLTVEIQTPNKKGEYINHISIVPFFGYDQIASIKNIKITSIKLLDETVNKTTDLFSNESVYIGSDISAPSLSLKNRYFYNKGVFKFEKIKANKIYITFEQSEFKEVTIKHAYWTPYETRDLATQGAVKWMGQDRFTASAIVSDANNYRSESVSWDKTVVVPFIGKPTEKKSSTTNIVRVNVKYFELTNRLINTINFIKDATPYYYRQLKYIQGGGSFRVFVSSKTAAEKYTDQTTANSVLNTILQENAVDNKTGPLVIIVPAEQDIEEYVNSIKKKITSVSAASNTATITCQQAHGLAVNDYVYVNTSSDLDIMTRGKYKVSAINGLSFSVAISTGALALSQLANSFFIKVVNFPTATNLTRETSQDTADAQKNKDLFLRRNFEYLKADRAAIGIRDIFVGYESYADVCEIVSKPYKIYGKLELLSLQVEDHSPVEVDSSGEIIGTSRIDYYISVDNGSKWIQISPMEKNFAGIPEVLAFNQNLSATTNLSQIAYFNSPEVPQEINSVVFKAVMKKDRVVNSTPIIYSYKIGMKVV
jgi:hypothetical protein